MQIYNTQLFETYRGVELRRNTAKFCSFDCPRHPVVMQLTLIRNCSTDCPQSEGQSETGDSLTREGKIVGEFWEVVEVD